MGQWEVISQRDIALGAIQILRHSFWPILDNPSTTTTRPPPPP